MDYQFNDLNDKIAHLCPGESKDKNSLEIFGILRSCADLAWGPEPASLKHIRCILGGKFPFLNCLIFYLRIYFDLY